MKTFKQYLKEAQQINYDLHDSRVIRGSKENIAAARDILKDQKEMIPDINNATNVSQFDTEEQRDAVVAAYILMNKQPEYAQQIGIDIQNPKNFEMMVKDEIINPTRIAAKETGKKNPTIEEVKNVGQPKPTEKEIASDEKESADLRAAAGKTATPEEKPEPESEPQEPTDAEEPEVQDEEPSKETTDTTETPADYMAPKKAVAEIEAIRKAAEEEIRSQGKENPTREQQATIDRLVNNLNSTIDKYKKTAAKADSGYSVNPTRMSKMKASVTAMNALDKARSQAALLKNKATRKQLESGAVRMVKRGKETIQSGINKVKKIADTKAYKDTKAALKRGAEVAAPSIKRGLEQAKAATGRVLTNINQNTTAKMIGQELGTERAQEYIEYLRNGDNAKAEALSAQAAKQRQAKQSEARYNRMDSRVKSREDKALKQADKGTGGARASAIAKKVTDKFRRSSGTSAEEERRRA